MLDRYTLLVRKQLMEKMSFGKGFFAAILQHIARTLKPTVWRDNLKAEAAQERAMASELATMRRLMGDKCDLAVGQMLDADCWFMPLQGNDGQEYRLEAITHLPEIAPMIEGSLYLVLIGHEDTYPTGPSDPDVLTIPYPDIMRYLPAPVILGAQMAYGSDDFVREAAEKN